MQPSPQAQGRGGQQSQHVGQSRSAYLPCLFSPHSLGFQSATPILLSPSLVSSTPFLLPFSPAVLFLVSNLQRGLYLRARGASPASPTEQVKDVCISSSIYSAAPAGGRLRVLSPESQPESAADPYQRHPRRQLQHQLLTDLDPQPTRKSGQEMAPGRGTANQGLRTGWPHPCPHAHGKDRLSAGPKLPNTRPSQDPSQWVNDLH